MEAFKLVLLLVLALWVPGKPVDAVCNKCVDAHTCISETQFQICFDGVRNQSITYTCPDSKPICTDYDIICMPDSTGTPRGCGDVSQCGLCTGSNIFACTSVTTFAVCNDGAVFGNNYSCAENYVCSATAAVDGDPCVTRCNVADSEICDRVLETDGDGDDVTTVSTESSTETSSTTPDSSTITSSGTSPSTITTETSTGTTSSTDTSSDSTSESTSASTSDSTSESTSDSTSDSTSESTTGSTAAPAFNEVVYCQGLNSTGRYPIPNDTACTSYIYCVFKGTSFTGLLYNCTAAKPYFDTDINNCGTEKPALAGCTN